MASGGELVRIRPTLRIIVSLYRAGGWQPPLRWLGENLLANVKRSGQTFANVLIGFTQLYGAFLHQPPVEW